MEVEKLRTVAAVAQAAACQSHLLRTPFISLFPMTSGKYSGQAQCCVLRKALPAGPLLHSKAESHGSHCEYMRSEAVQRALHHATCQACHFNRTRKPCDH